MSYFPCDIPYMSDEELRENGIKIHKDTETTGMTNADDLISRQAAIDAVCMEWCNVKHQDCKHLFDDEKDDYYWCDGCETVLRTLSDLPSAQPEITEDDVKDYCRKRCLIVVTSDFYDEMMSRWSSAQPEVIACGSGELNAESGIVQCKDCKYWERKSICDGYCDVMSVYGDEDFYCGYAERRTDESD